jgi:hypothetical protein
MSANTVNKVNDVNDKNDVNNKNNASKSISNIIISQSPIPNNDTAESNDSTTISFEDSLMNEKKKYEKAYNDKKTKLREKLEQRNVLKAKLSETEEVIESLVSELKNAHYKTTNNDVEDEMIQLLS